MVESIHVIKIKTTQSSLLSNEIDHNARQIPPTLVISNNRLSRSENLVPA